MKYNIKKFLKRGIALLCTGALISSCQFLDREPIDQLSPDSYHITAEQLGGFTINYYGTIFRNNSGWFAGVATFDDGTDNQAALGGNESMFLQDIWKVPTSGGIGFGNIRNLNKFIEETEAKYAEKKITGNENLVKHYIGEAYLIRAMLYFDKLKTFGDFPIVTTELNIDADLAAASKRMPRNEVARQILKDLDKAISLLQNNVAGKLRITKNAALALKSRVALYEGTFEKYHRGSGRVPGDANWPGKDKEWNKGKTFNQETEVNFFLDEAMKAAKEVAGAVSLTTQNSHVMNPGAKGQYNGWNRYYDMFASVDMSGYPEILMWRQFNSDISVAHLTSNKMRTGTSNGWTRGLVESFLMKNGLPIYATGSGYKGDKTIDLVKTDRDERLQLFIFGESDVLAADQNSIDLANKDKAPSEHVSIVKFVLPNIITNNAESKDVTGYRQRKFYNYDPAMHLGQAFSDVTGQILVRVEEAMLNYIEACYVKNGSLDADATSYWTALRNRAGITAPIQTTISATDMTYEADTKRPSYDWGAFSGGKPVDATLYSIRRERRSEFAGEGYRMDDLKRWAAMDQVKDYHIEGANFWDSMYSKFADVVADGSEKAKVSSKELSKYLRPYQINMKYNLYKGYTFYQAHYLSPFSVQEMQLTSPDGNVNNTYLYQNIYWPITPNGMAEK